MLQAMRAMPPVLLLAACTPAQPPPLVPSPAVASTIDCHIAEVGPGELSLDGAQGQVSVRCTARNDSGEDIEACATPYIGVLASGAVYATHAPVCFELGAGETGTQVIGTQVSRQACRFDLGGCAVRTFTLDPNMPPVGSILEFARSVEGHARALGHEQPTVRECYDLVHVWQQRPGFTRAAALSVPDTVMACRLLARVDFECLHAAQNDQDLAACAPRR